MDHEDNKGRVKKCRTQLRASLFGGFQLRGHFGAEIPISNRRARAFIGNAVVNARTAFVPKTFK